MTTLREAGYSPSNYARLFGKPGRYVKAAAGHARHRATAGRAAAYRDQSMTGPAGTMRSGLILGWVP